MLRSDVSLVMHERDRVTAMTGDERAAQSLSFSNLQSLLYQALPWDAWVVDFGADWVVVEVWRDGDWNLDWDDDGGEFCLVQVSYKLDGNKVVLGDDETPVVSQIVWESLSQRVKSWSYAASTRAKYTQDEIDDLGKKGQAFKNDDGHYSYPIADKEDLDNAIHAVGRGSADHDAIRKYIIKRASALGEGDAVPENWNSDGSIEDSSREPTAKRSSCPACGSASPAQNVDGEMRCPDCSAYRGDSNMGDGTKIGGAAAPSGIADGTGSVSSCEHTEERAAGGGCGCCDSCQANVPPKSDDDGTLRDETPLDALARTMVKYFIDNQTNSLNKGPSYQAGTDGTSPIDNKAGPEPGPGIDSDADGAANHQGADQTEHSGSDGSEPAGQEGSDDADDPPHPDNDDDASAAQREDPDVDEGGSQGETVEPDADHVSRSQRRRKNRRSSTPAPRAERRVRAGALETLKSTGEPGPMDIQGRAIVYDAPYTVYDMFGAFTERMHPGVCNEVLSRSDLDCRYLINHEGIPLGRTTSGTLELLNGAEGLDVLVHLSDSSRIAADLYDAISRRDVTQQSIGFRVAEDEWDEDYMNRTVYSFSDLLDASSVTYPASPTTSIEVAKRMLFALPIEARNSVAQAFNVVCDIRAGQNLDSACSTAVLNAIETLYNVDDPTVSLVRVREAWKIARDVRAGKTLSTANAAFIAAALESLHQADDVDIPAIVRSLENIDGALDEAQSALAQVSGLPDPDDDDDPTRTDEGESIRRRESTLEQAAERRRRAAKSKRKRLSVGARPVA